MESASFWPKLKDAFGNQKAFWSNIEHPTKPGITDRLLHYIISYYENPSVARKAVRIFRGLETNDDGLKLFSDRNEVRVSTLLQIEDALRLAGSKYETFDLAVTIRDFLDNAWSVIFSIDLSDVAPEDKIAYLRQLQGKGTWGKKDNKDDKAEIVTPFRSAHSYFYKQCKKYRKPKEKVMPDCAFGYLEYLWKRTRRAPFENHANRILSRLGIFQNNDPINTKTAKFDKLLTEEKPISKHKHLVQLGKTICLTKNPRCSMCPLSSNCISSIKDCG